jgi:hypothetical protein
MGLWEIPSLSIATELALVAAGAWLYFRAARAVSLAAGIGSQRAILAGALILLGGIGVLALDVSGILG